MKKYGLNKKDKLCSTTSIDLLFSHSKSSDKDNDINCSIAYPLRAVWRKNILRTDGAPIQFLISVPKKRLHHAVDRVRMRRLIRESYRLVHNDFTLPDGSNFDLAFIYIANEKKDFNTVRQAVNKIMNKISFHEKDNTK